MNGRGLRRVQLRSESGQILPLLAAGGLVVLLGFTALVLDVGHARLVQRRLQASADAAALAGAQALPGDTTAARTLAASYSSEGKNAPGAGSLPATPTIVSACSTVSPPCAKPDSVVVTESAEVPAHFAQIFGVGTFHVRARAAACGSCGDLPLDVMILLDRTGSMSDGDMANAQRGIETLLRDLDPRYDRVGFAVTPPAMSMSPPYNADPYATAYPASTDANYVLTPLSSDYLRPDGTLNTSSRLVSTIESLNAAGATSYALALEKANAELTRNARTFNGRPVHKVLIFMSDGAANAAQLSAYPDPRAAYDPSWTKKSTQINWSPYILRPCGQAVASASAIKGSNPDTGTEIFTIGYGIDPDSGENQCFQAPHYGGHDSVDYREARENMTARTALQRIASPGDGHYLEPAQGEDLRNIFRDIAGAILPPKLIAPPAGT